MNAICKRTAAIVLMAIIAIGLTTCKKEKIDVPTVKVFEGAITINYTKASVSAEVTDQGGAEVKLRGFVYGESGGAMDTIFCGSGTGVYSAELTNLEPNTTYVYEAFAKNSGGFGNSSKVSFTTRPLPTYTIDVSANPSHGGTAIGSGSFQKGQSCTVKATPNTGFNFVNWKENDIQVSTNSEYTFEVTANRNLVAQFTSQANTIIATPEPEEGGSVSGSGGYDYGDLCTLSATDNPGYAFVEWTENGAQVSTHREYTFEVTGDRNLVAHFNQQTYTITASAEPEEYGTVSISGNGVFHYNEQCTLTATTVNQGYSFMNWTKNGIPVSTQVLWTFAVTESAEYVAHFQIAALNLTVYANPEVIAKGSSSQLNATASSGNGSFTYRWTPSTGLSNANIQNPTATPNTTTTYTCTVTSGSQTASGSCKVEVVCPPTLNNPTVNGNSVYLSWPAVNPATSYKVYRGNTMIAQNVTTTSYTDNNLSPGTYTYRVSTVYQGVESPKSTSEQATISQAPTGAINGKFTINDSGSKVYFSRGNLQYQASTNTWRFAESQWNYVGGENNGISESYSGWIDLFGWGTSGWNCGNTYYRPWDSNNSCAECYGPPGQYNLSGSYAHSDWGVHNAIINGGSQAGLWRTLTLIEWVYVFNRRSTSSGIRYAKAEVAGVNGVILLPDDWSTSFYSLNSTNQSGAPFHSNEINSSVWTNNLQAHGAVFLPAAGYRFGASVNFPGSYGAYWSASFNNATYSGHASGVHFSWADIITTGSTLRCYGRSVRLVCPAE